VTLLIFPGSIDFIPGVGYAKQTFAVHSQNDNWGISWNGQHLLLKKFALTAKSTHTLAPSCKDRNALP
jgi:hypothetical protein